VVGARGSALSCSAVLISNGHRAADAPGSAHHFPKVAPPTPGGGRHVNVSGATRDANVTDLMRSMSFRGNGQAVTASSGGMRATRHGVAYFGASLRCLSQLSLNGAQMASFAITCSKICPICVANRSVSNRKTRSARGPRFT
jgi:hypothetical protein